MKIKVCVNCVKGLTICFDLSVSKYCSYIYALNYTFLTKYMPTTFKKRSVRIIYKFCEVFVHALQISNVYICMYINKQYNAERVDTAICINKLVTNCHFSLKIN